MNPAKVIVCGVLAALLPQPVGAQTSDDYIDYIPLTSLVALGQSNAPGTTVNFLNFPSASFNPFGGDAFSATLQGAGVADRNDTGIWRGHEFLGPSTLIAREDGFAPGTSGDVRFDTLGRPLVNIANEVAFSATLIGQGLNSENNAGIWLFALGSRGSYALELIAREGNSAPSTVSGAVWLTLGEPTLNGAGQVAFSGTLRGAGIGQVNDAGVWAATTAGSELLAQEDQQAFGLPAGVRFSTFGEPFLNDQGHVTFTTTVTGQGVSSASDTALCVVTPEYFPLPAPDGAWRTQITVAREGDPAPEANGAKWNGFGEPVMGNGGQLAFTATLTGAGVADFSNSGIWYGSTRGPHLVAREDGPAPGVVSGTRWSEFFPPVINDVGQIAFRAKIRGSGVTTGSNDEGIWAGDAADPANLLLVARKEAVAPGVSDNARFETFGDPVIDGEGRVAFFATLTGSFNKRGIWAVDPNGRVQLMVREGRVFLLPDGRRYTVDAGSLHMYTARRHDRNVFGPERVAYRVKFREGTELYAVLVTALFPFSTPEPPPEPPPTDYFDLFFRTVAPREYTGGYREPGTRDPAGTRGADLQFTFRTVEGRTYALDARSDLTAGEWETLVPRIEGTGDRISLTLPSERDQDRRFFRVREDLYRP